MLLLGEKILIFKIGENPNIFRLLITCIYLPSVFYAKLRSSQFLIMNSNVSYSMTDALNRKLQIY